MKKCTRCKKIKTIDKFGKHQGYKDGHRTWCKGCISEQAKEYTRSENYKAIDKKRRLFPQRKEKMSDYIKKYRSTLKGELARQNSYLRRFGIDYEIYNRMFDEQEGCCKICGIHQSELKIRLSVDHCHRTGKIRALLCRRCNIGIGLFDEELKKLHQAYEYLKFHNRENL